MQNSPPANFAGNFRKWRQPFTEILKPIHTPQYLTHHNKTNSIFQGVQRARPFAGSPEGGALWPFGCSVIYATTSSKITEVFPPQKICKVVYSCWRKNLLLSIYKSLNEILIII